MIARCPGPLARAWAFFWRGRLCPRCREERTGHWGRWVTGVPFDEFICDTCTHVERIKFRDLAARRFF